MMRRPGLPLRTRRKSAGGGTARTSSSTFSFGRSSNEISAARPSVQETPVTWTERKISTRFASRALVRCPITWSKAEPRASQKPGKFPSPELLDARHGDEQLLPLKAAGVAQQSPEVVVPVAIHVGVHVEMDPARRAAGGQVASKHRLLLIELDAVATLGEPQRGRETGDAATGHRDRGRLAHRTGSCAASRARARVTSSTSESPNHSHSEESSASSVLLAPILRW